VFGGLWYFLPGNSYGLALQPFHHSCLSFPAFYMYAQQALLPKACEEQELLHIMISVLVDLAKACCLKDKIDSSLQMQSTSNARHGYHMPFCSTMHNVFMLCYSLAHHHGHKVLGIPTEEA